MSSNMNNLTPLPGARRTAVRAYDFHTPSHSSSNEVPVFYRSRSTRATPDDRTSGALVPRRWWEDRTPTGFYSMPDFPAQSYSRPWIYVLNGNTGRNFNPGFTEIVQQSPPPRSTPQPGQVLAAEGNSKSTTLSKLKKEVYNPAPKYIARRLSLHYRENPVNALKDRKKEKEEDGKRCAVCLEDFVPREEVMLTPCKHMFHEECIVPWVTSHGQCPVCRFVISERVKENSSSFNNNNIANMEPSDIIAGELLSILRAMEEAFHLSNGSH